MSGKYSPIILILRQFWFVLEPQPLTKRPFSLLTPSPAFFWTSNFLSLSPPHTHTHTHYAKYAHTVYAHPCGPVSRPLGWSDSTHHMQTASGQQFKSMTVILDTTRTQTHTGKEGGSFSALWFDTCTRLKIIWRTWVVNYRLENQKAALYPALMGVLPWWTCWYSPSCSIYL